VAVFTAFYDANILYPSDLRNFFMHLAMTDLFRQMVCGRTRRMDRVAPPQATRFFMTAAPTISASARLKEWGFEAFVSTAPR
jgi:hypothetical protein